MASAHDTVTPSQHLSKIIRILSKPQTERSPVDKRLLLELTQDIKFFQQYEGHPFVHENCCCYMLYEFHQEGETVFEINTVGDKFYIILEGTVGVYIENECQDNITSEFLISDYPSNGNLNCVKCLGKGSSFGELALLYDSPRMASIICHSDCHFAVLPKKEFLRVMKNEQKDMLNQKLQYLSKLIVFSKINQQLLRQIYSKAFYISTTKDQYVYKQGQLTEHFYIVRAGEFAVKKHSIEEEELLTNQLKEDNNHSGIRKLPCIEKNLALFGPLAKKNKQHDLQLSLLVEPDYFGEEDILWGNAKRSFSVQCVTAEGEVIMIQKQLFLQVLSSLHTSQFIEQHLAIKEKQFYQRIENAKVQFEKFKGYLLEDRKGGWQERQDIKERQEKLEKQEIQERKIIAKIQQEQQQMQDQNSLHSMKNRNEHQLSRQDLRDKNIILQNTQVIDAESQRILEEKIIRFIQERYQEVSTNRKAQLPTLQEIKDHNLKHQEALRLNKSSHFIRLPQDKKNQLASSQESSFIGGASSVGSSSRPQSSLLSQLQRQLLKHSAAQMADSINFKNPDHHFVSALSSYFHKNSSQNTISSLANDTDTQPFMCSSLSLIKMQQQQSQNQQGQAIFEPPQFQETDILQQSPEFVIPSPNIMKRKTSIKFFEETKRDIKGMTSWCQQGQGREQDKYQQVSYNQSFERNNSMNLHSNFATQPIDLTCSQNLRSQSLKQSDSRKGKQVNSNSLQQRFLEQIMNRRLVKKTNVSTAAVAQHNSELNGQQEQVKQQEKQQFLIQNSVNNNNTNHNSTFNKTASTKNLTTTAGTTATSSFAKTITTLTGQTDISFKRRESQPLHSLSSSPYFSSSSSQIILPSSLSPARACAKLNKINNINNRSLQIKSSQFQNSANKLDNTLEHSKSFLLTPIKTDLQCFLDTTNNKIKHIHHGSQTLAQSIFANNKQTSSNAVMMTAPDVIKSPVPQKMSLRFYNIFKKNQN